MWLINVKTYELEYFPDSSRAEYVILSHRWRTEEVTFADIRNFWFRRFSRKKGWDKIRKCCELAATAGFEYAWVDTCCIDKSSSTELQEAINSMYAWYENSARCYVYLDDVIVSAELAIDYDAAHFFTLVHESEWFSRGWTLQELIASPSPYFFDRNWFALGRRHERSLELELITGIPRYVLDGEYNSARPWLPFFCVAEKMSWAAGRQTAREEDMAYCLFGLFDISMPMLYGEGARAFIRLQEEIIRKSADQSILAWGAARNPRYHWSTGQFLEDRAMDGSSAWPRAPNDFVRLSSPYRWALLPTSQEFKLERVGFADARLDVIMLPLEPRFYLAVLDTRVAKFFSGNEEDAGEGGQTKDNDNQNEATNDIDLDHEHLAIIVKRLDANGRYRQCAFSNQDVILATRWLTRVEDDVVLSGMKNTILLIDKLSYQEATAEAMSPHTEIPAYRVQSRSLRKLDAQFNSWTTVGCPLKNEIYLEVEAARLSLSPESLLANDLQPYHLFSRGDYGWVKIHRISMLAGRKLWPLSEIRFGFDFDFCPYCTLYFIDTDIVVNDCDVAAFFRRESLVFLVDSNAEAEIVQDGTLTFVCELVSRDSGKGFEVRFQDAKMQDWALDMRVYRDNADNPWNFEIEIFKETEPYLPGTNLEPLKSQDNGGILCLGADGVVNPISEYQLEDMLFSKVFDELPTFLDEPPAFFDEIPEFVDIRI